MNALTTSGEFSPLAETRRALQAFRQPSLEDVREALQRVRTYLSVSGVMREMDAPKTAELMCAPLFASGLEEISALEEMAASMLSEIIPVNDFALQEAMDDAGGSPMMLPVHCLNLAGSWDEFDEILNEPNLLNQTWGATVFAHYFVRGVDGSPWTAAAEHFGWPILETPELATHLDKRLDWDLFVELLKANNLEEFKACFSLAFWDTGSVFLDMDEEQLWNEGYSFDTQTIRFLAAEYKKAEAVLEMAQSACNRAIEDPTIYHRLLELLEAATVMEETHERNDDGESDDDYAGDDDDDDPADA